MNEMNKELNVSCNIIECENLNILYGNEFGDTLFFTITTSNE